MPPWVWMFSFEANQKASLAARRAAAAASVSSAASVERAHAP